ncbi:glycosyltransferase family 4 protein [bacterium]|nr:glycosyltransferase family 4 protein [candidate division CSSED10-310 bacterium]
MRIALLAPSPVPFTRGGVENLISGLHYAINTYTSHAAEIIKIPIREDNFWTLIQAYWKFSRIQLNHFDVVISFKYPAWMSKHHHHILYMCHRLRGLYDTYTDTPVHGMRKSPFRFPGPLIRKIIHFLDSQAINPKRISRTFAISQTVASRLEYFHSELPPTVVYPPPVMKHFEKGHGKHFFTVSRLDGPKRIDLILRAYRSVNTAIPLLVAGTGPLFCQLEYLASEDSRVSLLGDVSDEELKRLYAESIGVIYIPNQEDYGYVAIEAMKSGKPVITMMDSGGPLEFVRDGETGCIAAPNEQSLAEKIQFLADNPEKAFQMGELALTQVNHVSWTNTIESLLGIFKKWPDSSEESDHRRKRILVLVPYPVYPPRSGGQRRIAALYKELSAIYDVWLLTVGRYDQTWQTIEIAPYFHEVRIPISSTHAKNQWMTEEKTGVAISDVLLPDCLPSTPNFLRTLRYFESFADVIITSQPYLHPFLKRIFGKKLIIHESQNVETILKAPSLSTTKTGRQLLALVRKTEKFALHKADKIFAISNEEIEALSKTYKVRQSKFIKVPNGIDTQEVMIASHQNRLTARSRFKVENFDVVLFIGAWHPPNLEAYMFIIDNLTHALPNCKFLVMGSVKQQYEVRSGKTNLPSNLMSLGEVDEQTRLDALAASDLAINPMFTGAGTNLKVLEYFAAGLCVVSTSLGVRGINAKSDVHYVSAEKKDFAEKISLTLKNPDLKNKIGASARHLAEQYYDWKIISKNTIREIEKLLPVKGPMRITADMDTPFVYGWYPTEYWKTGEGNNRLAVRWSYPEAHMLLADLHQPFKIILTILPGLDDHPVLVKVEDKIVFDAAIKKKWQTLVVRLESIPGCDLRKITIISRPWQPSDGGLSDNRVLGVALSCVQLEKDDNVK